MLRLPEHRLLPLKAEPRQILENGVDVLGSDARNVDVLDPQQKAPAEPARHVEPGQRGQRVAKMQLPIGARRETEDWSAHVLWYGAGKRAASSRPHRPACKRWRLAKRLSAWSIGSGSRTGTSVGNPGSRRNGQAAHRQRP